MPHWHSPMGHNLCFLIRISLWWSSLEMQLFPISAWRTVGALRKCAGGTFLVPTAAALPRGSHTSSQKIPEAVCSFRDVNLGEKIISWRTGGHEGAPPVTESSDRNGWAAACLDASKAKREGLAATRSTACSLASSQSPLSSASTCGESCSRSLAPPSPMRPAARGPQL